MTCHPTRCWSLGFRQHHLVDLVSLTLGESQDDSRVMKASFQPKVSLTVPLRSTVSQHGVAVLDDPVTAPGLARPADKMSASSRYLLSPGA